MDPKRKIEQFETFSNRFDYKEAMDMGGALRILQAGELRLDEPIKEFSSTLPHNIQNDVVNARYNAARHLFEAAITKRVDLVLLAGKLCTNENDSRAYWFLQEQFEQLLKDRIVVVCAETTNSFRWPSAVPLPDNVRVLNRRESIQVQLNHKSVSVSLCWKESPAAVIRQRQSDFHLELHEKRGCMTSVGYRAASDNHFESMPVHALQASSLSQSGPFQATLVEFDGAAEISSTPVQTEAIACESLQLHLDQNETTLQVRQRLIEEFNEIGSRPGAAFRPILLKLILSTSSPLNMTTQREFLSTLQDEARRQGSRVWPCRIEIEVKTSAEQHLNESLPLQLALEELAEFTFSDLSDDADRRFLNTNQQTFQRLKSQVALRLPQILAE